MENQKRMVKNKLIVKKVSKIKMLNKKINQ
jgi:hypothetical protein